VALAPDARVLRLADAAGLTRLALREDAAFEAHDDGAVEAHSDDQTDPHLWLDPENAKLWLDAIAAALAEVDPQNEVLYLANAAAARVEIDMLGVEIEAQLAPIKGQPFVVFHDAFQYFERRFGIVAAGAVAMSDARAPGPARIAEIRERIGASGAVCLFREPQYRSALVATVVEGTGVRIGLLDPLGASLAPGSDLYPNLLRGLAVSMVDCLG
jgi:zinc transport system substrate-binding protein